MCWMRPRQRDPFLSRSEKAASLSFRESLSGMTNPYGDGYASERIVEVLTALPDRDRLLLKLDPGGLPS